MKYVASLVLLTLIGFSTQAFGQTDDREQIHKKIADLRTELSKNEEAFLSPSQSDLQASAEFLKQPNTGLIRLLPRETYDKPTELTIRGGGAYYSFTNLKHEYGYGSDIELAQGTFSVGFAGADYGFLTDIGSIALQSITPDNPAVEYLSSLETPAKLSDARIEQQKSANGIEGSDLRFASRVKAVVGHTYLLRSVNYDRSDVLIAFQIMRQDQDGSVILAWKMLKKFDVPKLQREAEGN